MKVVVKFIMLKGEEIYLRLFEKEDLPLRVKWINDIEINRTLGFDFPVSLSGTEVWFGGGVVDNSRKDFAIVKYENDKLIGMAGLLKIDYKNDNTEFYITIGEKEYWGLRIADEVISLILEYVFSGLGLKKVYLHTFAFNVRARKVYERNGFVQEGIFRKHIWKNGELRDIVFYSILKSEWLKRGK